MRILFLLAAHVVTLSWTPTTAPKVTTQQVWRQIGCAGNFIRQAQVSPTTKTWIDDSVKSGKTYCYYVTAEMGKTSTPPSNTATAIIPNP